MAWDEDNFMARGEDTWPPRVIVLELVEGCPLRCHSCGIQGIREAGIINYNFMQHNVLNAVIREMVHRKWLSRLLLSGRGEPLMHPRFEQVLDFIRQTHPRGVVWLETSGYGLVPPHLVNEDPMLIAAINRLAYLVEAGISVITVGRREGTEKVWDLLDNNHEMLAEHTGVRVRRGMNVSSRGYRDLNHIWLMPDVQPAILSHTPAWSHAGAGTPRGKWPRGKHKRCARPVHELVIRYDGRVQLCQEDWRGEICLGDITKQNMHDIFYGPVARAARARAAAGLRDLRPCVNCNYLSDWNDVRTDRFVMPTEAHESEIRGALHRGGMTPPVLRPWERS